MLDDYEFTEEKVAAAFEAAGGRCECCFKKLAWDNSRANPGWGQWEAHTEAATCR
jgi:hypothetical protein